MAETRANIKLRTGLFEAVFNYIRRCWCEWDYKYRCMNITTRNTDMYE